MDLRTALIVSLLTLSGCTVKGELRVTVYLVYFYKDYGVDLWLVWHIEA